MFVTRSGWKVNLKAHESRWFLVCLVVVIF